MTVIRKTVAVFVLAMMATTAAPADAAWNNVFQVTCWNCQPRSSNYGSPAYALYGHEGPRPDQMPPLDTPVFRGRVAYHVRRGGHGLTPYDWHWFMDFADRLWGDHRDR